jgi:amino acid adenylation domain-containing protein/non-ribosomal peptide synthase protein (TIGR01720 family)
MIVESEPIVGVHDLLADRVRCDPTATAVVCGRMRITYAELAARSDALATRLIERGARPDGLVGLLLERGVDMVVALFAVLKAGAAYVPLHPDHPAGRLELLLADAGIPLVLTQRELAGKLPASSTTVLIVQGDAQGDPGTGRTPRPAITPDNLAYVMYTSGSTGRPNGVMVTHRGLISLFASHQAEVFDPAAREAGGRRLRVAHTAALSFDASWMPLLWMLGGHELHVIDQRTRLDPHATVAYLAEKRIDVLDETPAYVRMLMLAGLLAGEHRPRVIVTGGEAVDADLCAALTAAGVTGYNGYGTTESSVENLLCRAAECDGTVLGRPVAGTRAYVLDSVLHPVPRGTSGELYLAGPGLARGYLGQTGLTAASFVADPFGGPGSRMYRTGDLVRRRDDGLLDFLGRTGDQIKINGVRVEPGEAEAALLRHPEVAAAVVVARRDGSGHDQLVGYVMPDGSPASSSSPSPRDVRTFLSRTLPGHLVPSRLVVLAELPLTENGKVDRTALPAPPDRPDGGEHYVAPRDPAEELITGIWRDVLGIERIGVRDDFVELGGDSILAMKVISTLNRSRGATLPAQAVFEHPTIEALAANLPAECSGPAEAITATPRSALPLSFGQQRLWFLDQFGPGGVEYNTSAGFRLRGPVDLDALSAALNGLVQRHESLRTTFHTVDGRGVQVVNPPFTVPLDVRVIDESQVERELLDEAGRPFDLRRGPLLRALLLTLNDTDHLLVLGLHHIVTDGWSMGVLADELGRLYSATVRDEPVQLPHLPFRYADFAAWQRDRLSGRALDEQIAYWERQLAGVAVLELPTDRPRPVVRTSAGALHRFTVPASVTARLVEFGRSRGATLFTVLIAATQVLLARYTGQRDIALGTVTSGRTRAEVQNLVGFFVNTVVIRSTVEGSLSFEDFLDQVRSTVLDAVTHDEVPFDRLVELLGTERDASRSPLVQAMVVLQNAPASPPEMAGLQVEEFDLPRKSALFDLMCEFEPRDGELRATVEYSTELFDAATIRRMSEHLLVLLEGIVDDPRRSLSRLPLLPAAQRHRLLVEWNDSGSVADRCVHELFAQRARERPETTAVTFDGAALTYRELETRANRMAHGLIVHGVGPEVRVGICTPRGIDAIVGMLAVLKAGGAYVPIDPDYPDQRLSWLLEDSDIRLVLVGRAHRHRLPGGIRSLCLDDGWDTGYPTHAPTTTARPDNLIYVMYTSGSAGRPKGVLVEHRSVTRLCADPHVRLGAGDVLAQYAPLSFDASTFEVWGALLSGARLAICPGGVLGAEELGEFLRANDVTTLWLTAGMFHEIAAADPGVFDGLRRLVSGGDVLSPQHCAGTLRRLPHLELINGYGPTEGTTFTSCHRIGADDSTDTPVPIGRPITGTCCYVLDRDLNAVPVGVPGELYVGGTGLARGYLNRPELTAQRFVADPFGSGARLYRTGDVVRWRYDGVLDFVGRIDDQVKVRGFRVEVGEVETALRRHPAVAEAVVLAREDTLGHKRLVGYVVPRGAVESGAVESGAVETSELRAFLEAALPSYLVPGVLVILDRLPLTPNGKVDRKALPAPRVRTGRAYVAPRGPEEELLARVWAEVLGPHSGQERVGADDNFFDLGGDSILSIQVVSRARQLGLRLTSKDVFLRPTLAALAARATRDPITPRDQGPVSGPVPLSPIQHWFFETTTVHPEHFNQWVSVELPADVDRAALRTAVEALPRHHDALRTRFQRVGGQWRQEIAESVPPGVFRRAEASTSEEFRLETGPLFTAVLVESGARPRLVLVAHHLVVDGVSWRILLADLRTAYRQAEAGQPVDLGPRTTSFRDWSRRLHEHLRAGGFDDQLEYWATVSDGAGWATDGPSAPEQTVTVRLPAEHTQALLRGSPAAYRTRVDDLLVSALSRVLSRWTGRDRVVLEVEGHGREELFDDVDLSRSVGWFTTIYPLAVDVPPAGGWDAVIKSVKEHLRAVPDRGLGYGALRYLGNAGLAEHRPVLRLNYLGRFDFADSDLDRDDLYRGDLYRGAPTVVGLDKSATASGTSCFDVTAFVTPAGELECEWTYSPGAHAEQTVVRLAEETLAALREIIAHCAEPGSGGCTPSDFPLATLTQAELDRVAGNGRHVEDAYPLTPMQGGMLFHSLSEPGLYLEQICLTLADVPDLPALERAWQQAVDSIPALRTAVVWEGLREPLQVVHCAATLPITVHDWSGIPAAEHDAELRRLLAEDRATGLDLSSPPLMRVSLVRLGGTSVRLVWTFHHVILDGWSTFQVLSDVLAGLTGTAPPPRRRPFRDHLSWLSEQDEGAAERHWRTVLAGFRSPTRLPFDRPPGRAHRSRSTSTVDAMLSADDSALLYAFAKRHRLTVNAVVQGMWARLLARHSGEQDVCFGAVVSGRPAELPGVDSIVGMFVNTVPVRVTVDGMGNLSGWLRRLQAEQVESRRFEHVSLAQLQRWSELPAGRNLFDSIVVFENYPLDREGLAAEGLHLQNVTAVEVTNYPLNLIAHGGTKHEDRLTLLIGYDPALFDAETIESLADELVGLFKGVARAAVDPLTVGTPATAGPVAPSSPPTGGSRDQAYVAPRNPTEQALARIWADVLAVDRIGVDDDFFALGGDSILCVRVAARLRDEFGATLPPRTLFDNPTVGALALMFEHPTVEAMARLVDRDASPARDYEL